MKKKLFSLLLCLYLTPTPIPVVALANESAPISGPAVRKATISIGI